MTESKMAPPAPPPPDDSETNGEKQPVNAPMTNGPTTAGDGDRSWERAWSVDEMRKEAGNWSLAGDSGLLLFLQEFSQRMISRTHEIEKGVDSLVHQTKITGVHLNNVFNDFIMLANTQFVENRVYDEDVSQEGATQEDKKQENQEKTREQREAELIPKVSEALKYGISVIDNAFEALDVNAMNSDSEDEEIPYRADPILEAKDPYVMRPLPHIIGTPLFMQEDDVGLIEAPSDVETESHGSISESEAEEDKKDQSESESESDLQYSDSESGSISEGDKPVQKSRRAVTISTEEDSDSDGNLFDDKAPEEEGIDSDREVSSDEEHDTKPQRPAGAVDFTSELAAKIGVAPKLPSTQESDEEQGEEWEAASPEPKRKHEKGKRDQSESSPGKRDRSESSPGKEKKKGHHKHRDRTKSKSKETKEQKIEEADDGDLYDPPPDDGEDDSPFGKKGMFSAGKGLFDEEEDAGGLFDDLDDTPKKNKTATKKRAESKKRAETDEEGDDEHEEEEKPKEIKRPRTKSGKKVPAGGVSIFGGGDDELFSASTSKDDDNDEVIAEKKSSLAAKQSGGGGGLFDNDEEEDLFSSVTQKPAAKTKEKSKATSKPAASGMFGEDDDDDLFGDQISNEPGEEAPEPVAKKKVEKPKKKLPAGAVSMFGNAPNPLDAALKQKMGLKVSDDEDDEGNPSEGEKSRSGSMKSGHSAVSSNSSLNKPVEAVKQGAGGSPSGSSNSLFADEPEDDLFTTKPTTTKMTGKPAKNKPLLFGEDEEADAGADLFGGKEPKTTKKTEAKTKKPASSGGDLFGNDDAEEDLFGASAPKPRAESTTRKKPIGGVALFGGADLFEKKKESNAAMEKPVPVEKKAAEKNTAPPKTAPRKNTLSMFDNDGEDDLFGRGKTTTTTTRNTDKPSAQPPPVEKKPEGKSRTKSKSLFEDEDILFCGPQEDDPAVDLFGLSPPGSPQPEPAFKPTATVWAPVKSPSGVPVKGATTASSSTDLFLADEEDDLFGEKKTLMSKSESKIEPKDGKLDIGGATTTETSDDVEDKEPEVAAPVKPKKPAGAVSMFGGVDPFAELMRKQKATKPAKNEDKNSIDPLFGEGEESEEGSLFVRPKPSAIKAQKSKVSEPEPGLEKDHKPAETKQKNQVGGVSMFQGFDPLGGLPNKAEPTPDDKDSSEKDEDMFGTAASTGKAQPEEDRSASQSPPSPRGAIGKLKANLLINPAALLPGAAPPQKEVEPAAVSFDEPAEATTLHSAAKDRARILTRRRPPSRKARKEAVSKLEPGLDTDSDIITELPVETDDSSPPPKKNPSKASDRTASSMNSDLFGNDVLGKSAENERVSKTTDPILALGQDRSNIDQSEESIFQQKFTKSREKVVTKSGASSQIDINDNDDDLFAVSTSKSKSTASQNTVDDDLFADISVHTKKKSSKAASSTLQQSDPDSVTSVKATVSKEEATPPSDTSKGDQPAETKTRMATLPDDDDIFADSSIIKKRERKTEKKSEKKAVVIVEASEEAVPPTSADKKAATKPDLEDDDMFTKSKTTTTTKKERTKKKKAATKDEDLFKDDTDIFADLPASKPREKKKKKTATTTPSSSAKKSVFKDDVDDIFADTVVESKPKKETKKKGGKKTEDEPNIFDDPLNAAG